MHDALITTKDGQRHRRPIWLWRPTDGWLELAGEKAPVRIYLRDVASATHPQRIAGPWKGEPTITKQVDLLDRARSEGWNGT